MSRLPASRFILLASTIRRLPDWIVRPTRLRVYLGRGELAVCVVTGYIRPTLRVKAILPSPATGDDIHGDHSVAAALIAFGNWLQSHPTRGVIEWIIGIDHVRYLLLPWDTRLSGKTFCHILAAALFAQQFSESAIPFSAYQLRFAPLSFGRPLLAALIPSEVIDQLYAFGSHHRCRTQQISPALSVVWDRFFSRVKNGTGVLALVEGQRLLRAGYDQGHVVSVSVQPFSAERTPAISGGVIHCFPPRNITTPANGELSLRGLAADDDTRFAYALCGVF